MVRLVSKRIKHAGTKGRKYHMSITVKELKKELDNYPDNLEVFITDETVGGKVNIEFVSDDYVVHSKDPLDHTHYVTLVTNAYQGT